MQLPTYEKRDSNGNLPSFIVQSSNYAAPQPYIRSNSSYMGQHQSSWVNPYYSSLTESQDFRQRPNAAARHPSLPNLYQQNSNPYLYSMDHYGGNHNVNPLPSPGLQEVLASYVPGPTILCVEAKKKSRWGVRWFKVTTLTIILILILVGIGICGTRLYFGEKHEDRKVVLEIPELDNILLANTFQPSETYENPEINVQGFDEKDQTVNVVYSMDEDDEAAIEVVID